MFCGLARIVESNRLQLALRKCGRKNKIGLGLPQIDEKLGAHLASTHLVANDCTRERRVRVSVATLRECARCAVSFLDVYAEWSAKEQLELARRAPTASG
jgi:hypothetical protein